MTNKRISVLSTMRRILQERADYGNARSWLLNLYSRIIRRFSHLPFPGRGRVIAISVANTSKPVAVRLGTSDIFVANEIFSRMEYGSVVQRLPAMETVVDLGANIGLSMRYWRHQYPSAFIIGVEPDRANARLCRLNARLRNDGAGKTYVIRACAGESSRIVALNRSDDAWAFRMGADILEGPQANAVNVCTVPQILARTGCTRSIDLLKCDIEGGEEELFRHCRGWIARVRNMVVEVHPPYTIEKLTEALAANGGDFEVVESEDKGGGLFVTLLCRRSSVRPSVADGGGVHV